MWTLSKGSRVVFLIIGILPSDRGELGVIYDVDRVLRVVRYRWNFISARMSPDERGGFE
jgi:hypothetical protein